MKKLKIKKETIANLSEDQMQKVRGASIVLHTCLCNDTESCSLYVKCCPPPEGGAQQERNNG